MTKQQNPTEPGVVFVRIKGKRNEQAHWFDGRNFSRAGYDSTADAHAASQGGKRVLVGGAILPKATELTWRPVKG
jgi:hypothetical protein